jgi:serine/threonine protein kinase
MRERFYREARVTAQLVHPNIVTVFDLGEDRGRPYLVMERLHGASLVSLLNPPAPGMLELKIDLMLQTCDGLQAAHERGIVHRDLKPSNLFVQRDGGLKILDFGLAQLAASSRSTCRRSRRGVRPWTIAPTFSRRPGCSPSSSRAVRRSGRRIWRRCSMRSPTSRRPR